MLQLAGIILVILLVSMGLFVGLAYLFIKFLMPKFFKSFFTSARTALGDSEPNRN